MRSTINLHLTKTAHVHLLHALISSQVGADLWCWEHSTTEEEGGVNHLQKHGYFRGGGGLYKNLPFTLLLPAHVPSLAIALPFCSDHRGNEMAPFGDTSLAQQFPT